MALNSRYLAVSSADLACIGEKIRAFRRANGRMTQGEFAHVCARLTSRIFPDRHLVWTHERIGRLERAARGGTRAQALRERELEVLATALGTTVAGLLNLEAPGAVSFFDPTENDVDAERIRDQLTACIAGAREVHGWSLWPPCSAETPEFMRARHALIYKPEEAERWNVLGEERWRALREPKAWGRLHITNYIFLSDLQAISEGTGIYSAIGPRLRREELDEIIRVMAPPFEVRFVVADAARHTRARELALDLGGYSSVLVVDRRLVMCLERNGIVRTSDRTSRVSYFAGLLEEFAASARYRAPEDTVRLMEYLRANAVACEHATGGRIDAGDDLQQTRGAGGSAPRQGVSGGK